MVTLKEARNGGLQNQGWPHGFFLSRVPICSLKSGVWAQLDAKTLLGVLPSDEIPNELYELSHPSGSSLVQGYVCVSCERAFRGRDVEGAGSGEEMLSRGKGGDPFFPEVPGLSLALPGLVGTDMSPPL